MKYIFWMFVPSLVTFFMGEPYNFYGGLWAIFVMGFTLGLVVAYELIVEALSRGGDPKWDKLVKGLSDRIEAKRMRRRR